MTSEMCPQPVGCGREFELYSKGKRKSVEHFEEGSDLIWILKVLFELLGEPMG